MTGQAGLSRIQHAVGAALDDFLGRQRARLAGISEELLPWLDVAATLLGTGKRLRPAFCYWAWRGAGGADCPEILYAAAGLETLHASALIHDDVMDCSDIRRGRPSAHRQFAAQHAARAWRGSARLFGTAAAILAGDLLLGWADEMLDSSGLPADAVRRGRPVLQAMRTEVISGQFLEAGTVAAALRVARYKSAAYTVERPLHLGLALAGAPVAHAAALSEYGVPLGVAFQLRDDVLGVFGDPGQTGKPVSDDLREGKQTVLIALARERASADQGKLLDRWLGDPGLDAAAAAGVRAVITETGALAECERMIEARVTAALGALTEAPITAAARDALAELALHATVRSR
jgi:geranylgeranyl diphosphate synthase type I